MLVLKQGVSTKTEAHIGATRVFQQHATTKEAETVTELLREGDMESWLSLWHC